MLAENGSNITFTLLRLKTPFLKQTNFIILHAVVSKQIISQFYTKFTNKDYIEYLTKEP